MSQTDLLAELSWRGLIHQCTDQEGLSKLLGSGPQTVYMDLIQLPRACMSEAHGAIY